MRCGLLMVVTAAGASVEAVGVERTREIGSRILKKVALMMAGDEPEMQWIGAPAADDKTTEGASRWGRLCKKVGGVFGRKKLEKRGMLREVVYRNRDIQFLYNLKLIDSKPIGIVDFEKDGNKLETLNYRTATDLFVLNDNSPLFHPDFFFPLAVMANLSLTRTWRSRAGGLLLRRKYAPRWQAHMEPLARFADAMSETEQNFPKEFEGFLDGSCGAMGEQRVIASVQELMRDVKSKYYPYYGADLGLEGQWKWSDAVELGVLQGWCGMANYVRQNDVSFKAATEVLRNSMKRSPRFAAVMLAKAGSPHHFLTLLSKELPDGWKFGRGKNGLFGRCLNWLGHQILGDSAAFIVRIFESSVSRFRN